MRKIRTLRQIKNDNSLTEYLLFKGMEQKPNFIAGENDEELKQWKLFWKILKDKTLKRLINKI